MEKNPSMDFPDEAFRCPISKELMNDPVTICTGVTYELKNIQKWFYTYKKNTCPATMQVISSFDMTPNHTLKRLIESWRIAKRSQSHSSNLEISNQQADLLSLLNTIESTPFKVSYLKKFRSLIENGDEIIKTDLKKSGGVQVLVKIIIQILDESCDFAVFRACEEALGILHQLLPLCEQEYESDHIDLELLVKPNCIKSYALMLQRGSREARFFAVSLFYKLIKIDIDHGNWINHVTIDEGIDFFKSLLEIISDDEEGCTKSSRCALLVLIEILDSSKKSRLKAIEAGAVCTLIELIVCETNKSRCEKIMQLIKLICECADGRLAFIEHGLGIAAITKKILNVSNVATKIGVKILWLICKSHPTEMVLEEMLMNGAVKKLVAILNIDGGGEGRGSGRASSSSTSTKCRAIKMFKLHAKFWKRHPCFPRELHEFLGLGK